MKTLIITEKNSQAKALSGLMSKTKHKDGVYEGVYEGISFLILPLSGHIMEADKKELDYYNFSPPMKILPRSLPVVSNSHYKRLHANLKKTRDIHLPQIESLILATDPDPEGCAIALETIEYYGFDSVSDITYMNMSNSSKQALEKALIEAIRNKKDFLDWRRFAFSAHLRSDFALAGYASTLTTNKILKDDGHNAFYTLGVQQFRIFDLIIQRYKDYMSFDKSPRYKISVETRKGTFSCELDDEVDTKNKSAVEDVAQKIKSLGELTINEKSVKKKLDKSPKWYDGSHIGSKVSKKTGISVGEIYSNKDSVMQKMYENGTITYIRGEAKGKMPMGDFQAYANIATKIAPHYNAKRLDVTLVKPYLWRKEDSKEVVNHTPCTLAKKLEVHTFSGTERAVIDEASKQILATFYPDTKTISYSIKAKAGEYSLKLEDSETIDLGWKEIYGIKPSTLRNDEIREIEEGDRLSIVNVQTESYIPSPPSLFTEATLFEAIKKKGIGSDSTFGTMIDIVLDRQKGKDNKTIKREYFKLNNKKQIIPTNKGITFNDIFPKEIKEIVKAFENGVFKLFLAGEINEDKALEYKNKLSAKLYEEVTSLVRQNAVTLGKFSSGGKQYAKALNRETDISCPACGANVVEKNKTWSCSTAKYNNETKKSTGCGFFIYKESTKGKRYTVTEEILSVLCKEGESPINTRWEKSHATIESKIKLTDDNLSAEVL